jgi:hypothetical protein
MTGETRNTVLNFIAIHPPKIKGAPTSTQRREIVAAKHTTSEEKAERTAPLWASLDAS